MTEDTETPATDAAPTRSIWRERAGWLLIGLLLSGLVRVLRRTLETRQKQDTRPTTRAPAAPSPGTDQSKSDGTDDENAADKTDEGTAESDVVEDSTSDEGSSAVVETDTDADELVFQLDSLTLQECFEEVCEQPGVESLVYLTGPEVSGKRIVSQVFTVEAVDQSMTNVDAHPDVDFDVLQQMSESGHQFHAYCHNHPGDGEAAARPSTRDLDSQARLESINHEAIGLIATPDGYVRAFSDQLDFQLEVYGDNVRRIDDRTFELEA